MLPPTGRLFIGLLFFATCQRPAIGLDFDRFNGFCSRATLEEACLQDAGDGSLDECSLLRAALICAGHDQERISELERVFEASVRRCRGVVQADAGDRAAAILGHLKNEFLKGAYRPELFDVGRTILQGEFNCLTATILYQALCREFSLEVQALWEPSHVRSWVAMDGRRIGFVVETTASSVAEAVGPRTIAGELADRPLTKTELLGKVLYNRGVSALVNERFADALSTTWASCLLDPQDHPAQSNLRACLNNWALAAAESDRSGLAKQLLEAGMQLDPDYEPFYRNWALIIGNK